MDPVTKTAAAIKHSGPLRKITLYYRTITITPTIHPCTRIRLENSSILINTQSHHPANKFTFTMFNP